MADINVERKGPSIWPWIIGLIILALLIWALAALLDNDDDEVVLDEPVPAVVEEPIAPAPIAGAALPVAAILANPASYMGQTVSGTAMVGSDPTDRGFWIEDQGQRMLVVINEPPNETININEGQMVRLTDARVYNSDNMMEIAGQLDADTRQIAEGEPAVLAVNWTNVDIMERPGM